MKQIERRKKKQNKTEDRRVGLMAGGSTAYAKY